MPPSAMPRTPIQEPEPRRFAPVGEDIVETATLSEIIKTLTHRGIDPHVYFWRTTAGLEVDFVVETNETLAPIEIKSSATPRPPKTIAIKAFQRETKFNVAGICSPSRRSTPAPHSGVTAMPFADL